MYNVSVTWNIHCVLYAYASRDWSEKNETGFLNFDIFIKIQYYIVKTMKYYWNNDSKLPLSDLETLGLEFINILVVFVRPLFDSWFKYDWIFVISNINF